MPTRHDRRSKSLGGMIRFIGSYRFAVPLLIISILAMASGTLIELAIGAEAARSLVYVSWWFITLMVLICLSLIFSTVIRLPWKKRHTGFILVHASLIGVLISGFVSYSSRIEETLSIKAGSPPEESFNESMPFALELRSIRQEFYPGTAVAMSVECDIFLAEGNKTAYMHTLSMIGPLKHRGWKIYLTGLDESNTDTAVFRITKDPGLPALYASCVTLFLGSVIMYCSKAKQTGLGSNPSASSAPTPNRKRLNQCDG